jgi:hypothetical protein
MPPRKVKIVSMGKEYEPPTSTLVILDDNEDITPPETVASSTEAVEKPLLDTEEIDQMLNEMQKEQKKQPEQEECINCGKTMSKKSLKYSHIKNCKGRAIVIPEPVIPEPVVPEPVVVRPKTKRAPAKPKAKPESTVVEPITEKAKVVNDALLTQSQTRHELRKARISLLTSQAF